MKFNADAFRAAEFAARTAEVEIPELAPWCSGRPVFVVRGLNAHELAAATEAADTAAARAGVLTVALDGTTEERIGAVKAALGLSEDTPRSLALANELILRGTVEPVLDRETVVLLGERFPVDHKILSRRIMELTGQGQEAKKKPNGSMTTDASATH